MRRTARFRTGRRRARWRRRGARARSLQARGAWGEPWPARASKCFEDGGNRREWQVLSTRRRSRLSRRALLAGVVAGAIAAGLPRAARAEPRPIRVGALHPVSGTFADVGLACRLGAQLAVDAVNAAGGIQSLDGAPLELIVGDSAAGAATEAERLYNAGACALIGAFHSGQTRAGAAVARRRGLPFLIDTAIADGAMLPLVGGERPVIFRNFPTTTVFARRALTYLGEMFAEAKRPITRVTLVHTTDPL